MAPKSPRIPLNRRCGSCGWWHQAGVGEGGQIEGRCLINPPVVLSMIEQEPPRNDGQVGDPPGPITSAVATVWPMPTQNDGCHDHQTPEEIDADLNGDDEYDDEDEDRD